MAAEIKNKKTLDFGAHTVVLYKTVSENIADENILYAPVAQLDRVFGYEPKGRGFESLLAYQINRLFRKK